MFPHPVALVNDLIFRAVSEVQFLAALTVGVLVATFFINISTTCYDRVKS
jgi:hypothetical protein